MRPTIVIHRSTAYLAFRLVSLEFCLEAAYLVGRLGFEALGTAAGYNAALFGTFIQFCLFVLQIGLMVYVLARWANDKYELRENEIVIKTGIAPHRETTYPYNNMQSITVKVSLLGHIMGAGEVSAFLPTLGHDVVFSEVPNPQEFAATLKAALPYPDKGQFVIKR